MLFKIYILKNKNKLLNLVPDKKVNTFFTIMHWIFFKVFSRDVFLLFFALHKLTCGSFELVYFSILDPKAHRKGIYAPMEFPHSTNTHEFIEFFIFILDIFRKFSISRWKSEKFLINNILSNVQYDLWYWKICRSFF